jgi:hypothetical protein
MPTLWDAADNVTQVLFPGAHSDVGGGYPSANRESCLSDCTLLWMMSRLTEIGVRFAEPRPLALNPDPTGTAHKPWEHFPFNVPTAFEGERDFPAHVAIDPSVQKRMAAAAVVGEPGEAPEPYEPENLP